ncbi:uncharacterized protein CEXT_234871, partial [Caerostris extrusa]
KSRDGASRRWLGHLGHYLDKHAYRCRSGHRLSTSAKLTMVQGKSAIPSMHVTYNRPSQPPSSNPSSPQSHRRSLSYMSPTTARRCHHPSSSPPTSGRPLPIQPLPCSDDSSTSSLQDTLERKTPPKIPPRRVSRDGATSSDEDIENSDDESFKRMPRRSIERRELVFKDTVPSSWKYLQVFRERNTPNSLWQLPLERSAKLVMVFPSSRLPALTPRTDNKQPPKVGKVSPRPHIKQNWNETRSQSSEDLFQTPSSGPAQTKNLIFHSRGPSPVNIKGRNASIEGSFRRNDPKRHSSPRINQRSNPKMQLSPPKFISRSPVMQQTVRNAPNGQPTRRMFWSPERSSNTKTVLQRKNSAPSSPDKMASPVLEKLLQHSDLCTDKNFIEKIEQLIAEFQAKTKFEDSNEYDEIQYNSLPVNLNDEIDSKPIRLQAKKLPFENNPGKSPSKIPLPTWYSKCHS